jgi:hypothetical protein
MAKRVFTDGLPAHACQPLPQQETRLRQRLGIEIATASHCGAAQDEVFGQVCDA